MAKKQRPDDPSMTKVRALFKASGLSLAELGRKMSYADETARQSAWQFLKTTDPHVSMLRRFAEAMGIAVGKLLEK
jgi:transcriptional regulator with XRE-family HTH domain